LDKECNAMSGKNTFSVEFDHYYTYDELTAALKGFAEHYPQLATLESIGKSYEGRDIWLITLTNSSTGAAETKPAMYIDGNHHAGEVMGAMTALYTVQHLLNRYGEESKLTRLLDRRTFYIVPRVSPDGAELYLTTPELLRSSVRPWPYDEPQDGLIPRDVDGDGRITQMRLADPHGEWKVSTKDPRIMTRRAPHEFGGEYYRLYTEGLIENYDGYVIEEAPPKYGLDFNRNYGSGTWKGEHRQKGAGPYPLSEPETRAIARFISEHKNIAGAMSYHTTGGVILRASCTKPDKELNQLDLRQYRELGDIGKEFTGYPCVSIFEEFTVDKARPSVGSFLDFTYGEKGILTFATELWDLQQRAGIPRRTLEKRMQLKPEQREDDAVKLLQWVDDNLEPGQGFYEWTEFDHPQLGTVELGGFDVKYLRQNPPEKLLQQECEKNMQFTLAHAAALPELRFKTVEVEAPSEDIRVIRAVIENVGYQPSYVTARAKETETNRPIEVELELSPEAALVAGDQTIEIDELTGRVQASGRFYAQNSAFGREKKLEWVVQLSEPTELTIRIDSQRAGKPVHTVELK
jgi:murein tripeptide amidase MpaA